MLLFQAMCYVCFYSMGSSSHQYSEKGYFHNLGIDNIDVMFGWGQFLTHGIYSRKEMKLIPLHYVYFLKIHIM